MRIVLSVFVIAALTIACDKKDPAPAPEPAAEPNTAEPEKKVEAPAPASTDSAAALPSAGAPENTKAEPGEGDPKAGATAVKGERPPPTGSAEPEKPSDTKGEVVNDTPFAVWLQGSGKYKVGQAGALTAVLKANDPFHCNEKYPYKFKLDPAPAGVSFPSDTVRGMTVGAKQSSMSIPFTPSAAGAHRISGELSFSVCTDEKCLIEKRKVAVSVKAE